MWGSWYCRLFHSATMLPFRGKWTCRICLREYPCLWQIEQRVNPCYPKKGYSAREIGGKIRT